MGTLGLFQSLGQHTAFGKIVASISPLLRLDGTTPHHTNCTHHHSSVPWGHKVSHPTALSTAKLDHSLSPCCSGHVGHRLCHFEAIRWLVSETSHSGARHRRSCGRWHSPEDCIASHAGSHRTNGEPLTGHLLDVICQRATRHTSPENKQTHPTTQHPPRQDSSMQLQPSCSRQQPSYVELHRVVTISQLVEVRDEHHHLNGMHVRSSTCVYLYTCFACVFVQVLDET